ncbi:hypothetical protein SJI45_27210 [Streptomyces sp. S399]|uniref:hypothetical protein n=1 Tax=Streptomyces sp. S399 TaxID=3096009 RepID=UPI002A836DE4|nr:hypothetical protein [Streptomyces sp. S399]WPR54151.1 hypothetical protein SJI45_27210 [Streptomyces sp. S399]
MGPAAGPGTASGSPGAQHVLLVLGGLLLAVAAIAFTLFSWGEMGIAGRATVLAAVTAAALAAPVPLLRRGLVATAESVAAVALLLTVLDAYALRAAVVPETDGAGYAALAAGVLAAGWTVYGLGLGRLRLPLRPRWWRDSSRWCSVSGRPTGPRCSSAGRCWRRRPGRPAGGARARLAVRITAWTAAGSSWGPGC